MSTYKELLQTAREFLKKSGIADADIDAWYLLAHVFGINRADFFMHENKKVSEDKALEYKKLIEKRASHVPLQYLTGVQEFMGLEFEVDENVLIPRQDTELLVEEVLKVSKDKAVLDMCTGSGCIIISLAKLGNIKEAVGIDISREALKVAKRNAYRLGAEVDFIYSDLFDNVEGVFDIIVSNPPYIKTEEILSLIPEVKDHEPKLALDAGASGLVYYKRIIDEVNRFLNSGGYLFFEIGYDQGGAVSKMLEEQGFIDINVKKDLSGLDRVVYGKRPF